VVAVVAGGSATEPWPGLLAALGRGVFRFERQGLGPGEEEVLDLDLARGRFFRRAWLRTPGGQALGACELGDGTHLWTWDPGRPEEARRDGQPPHLADALQHPLAVLLDPAFWGRRAAVSARREGDRATLTLAIPGARWEAAWEGDPPRRLTVTVEEDGAPARQEAYAVVARPDLGGRPPATAAPPAPIALAPPADRRPAPPAPELPRGTVALVAFWATWCGTCRRTLHHLDRLPQGTAVRALSRDPDPETAQAFVEARGYGFSTAWDGGALARAWAVRGLPTVFLVDRCGRIAAETHAASGEALAGALRALWAEEAWAS
jgi:cytochrome c biogenesis protein CcmG/thiol:disulfide interchange protein DsbE